MDFPGISINFIGKNLFRYYLGVINLSPFPAVPFSLSVYSWGPRCIHVCCLEEYRNHPAGALRLRSKLSHTGYMLPHCLLFIRKHIHGDSVIIFFLNFHNIWKFIFQIPSISSITSSILLNSNGSMAGVFFLAVSYKISFVIFHIFKWLSWIKIVPVPSVSLFKNNKIQLPDPGIAHGELFLIIRYSSYS